MMVTLIKQGATHGSFDKLPIPNCVYCQEKLAALRKRIRTLIEEARQEEIRFRNVRDRHHQEGIDGAHSGTGCP